MELSEILKRVDHTLLTPDARWDDIKTVCYDGIKYGVASVCIPQSFVERCARYVDKKVKICTVIGFPNGYTPASIKCLEAKTAIENGADEIDTVINIGDLKDKNYQKIKDELKEIKKVCGDKILKVIIETCLLTEDEKIKMCEIVTSSGADFIKTSTGFQKGGATKEDIALFKKYVGKNVKIKAAGGIQSLKDAEDFIALGADRLGTSRIIKIVKSEVETNGNSSY